ncbi:CRISPR-associated helicase Cas3', partial [Chloroflexota bacterium]
QLFLRLLAWLRAIGSSVIVLSATLPEKTRQDMAKAFCKETQQNITPPYSNYPRMTLSTSENIKTVTLPSSDDRTININWIDQAPETIVQKLRTRLKEGGCAAVICNTVQHAQDVYLALYEANLIPHDDLILFHSRFPPAWRKDIEMRVLRKFGKNGDRPQKAIVVATQVLEQSLDLDFDLMITDLAPIDLIIQRVGRLHRHKREKRPLGLETPQVVIIQPDGELTSPEFGSSGYVYQPFILWRTWIVLEGRTKLLLPGETSDLIESVYGEYDPASLPTEIAPKLEQAHAIMLKDYGKADYEAKKRLVPDPGIENLVTDPMQDLKDDEDPSLHPQIKALTRLIPPGVDLI